jgi:hypothetical protein
MKPRLCNSAKLMPPGVRRFRETVNEEHYRTFALFLDVHLETVRYHFTSHGILPAFRIRLCYR